MSSELVSSHGVRGRSQDWDLIQGASNGTVPMELGAVLGTGELGAVRRRYDMSCRVRTSRSGSGRRVQRSTHPTGVAMVDRSGCSLRTMETLICVKGRVLNDPVITCEGLGVGALADWTGVILLACWGGKTFSTKPFLYRLGESFTSRD